MDSPASGLGYQPVPLGSPEVPTPPNHPVPNPYDKASAIQPWAPAAKAKNMEPFAKMGVGKLSWRRGKVGPEDDFGLFAKIRSGNARRVWKHGP